MGARGKASFGSVRKLPSGRYQARYTGPDGVRHRAATTFDTKGDAEAWLAIERAEVVRNQWMPPEVRRGTDDEDAVTLRDYAEAWLRERELKPTTRNHYRQLLEDHILPGLGEARLAAVTPGMVRKWYATTLVGKPTARSHAYSLLRTIYGTAVDDEVEGVKVNPCRIPRAGSTKRKVTIQPASLDEITTAVEAMPDRLRAMVVLAVWCALRFGELAELRRKDIDLKAGVIRVRRGVTREKGRQVVGAPKTEAGSRDVAIPPHVIPMLKSHLDVHVDAGREALLFPAAEDRSRNLAPSSLYRAWYPAREAAGREDLRFHDLRHTGSVLAAQAGATLPELMGRLGHSSPQAAMRYQHAARDRDRAIASALSDMAGAS